MLTPPPRTRDTIKGLIKLALIAAGILLLFGRLHPAHAQPATIGIAPPANPLPDLTAAGGTAWDTFAANGLGWGAVAAVAALLHTFVSRQHWLTQGRTLAILTGAAGILVAVVNWHAGAPSAGILTAALIAIALVKKPTVPGATGTTGTGPIPTIGSSGGTALRGSVGAAILVCLLAGCHSPVVAAAGRIAWDCTASERKQGVDLLLPLATNAILTGASSDGMHVDLAALKSATSKASLLTDLGVTLWCAASEAIAQLSNPAPASPGAPQSAPALIDPGALRSAWRAVKPDSAFITSVVDAQGNQVVM